MSQFHSCIQVDPKFRRNAKYAKIGTEKTCVNLSPVYSAFTQSPSQKLTIVFLRPAGCASSVTQPWSRELNFCSGRMAVSTVVEAGGGIRVFAEVQTDWTESRTGLRVDAGMGQAIPGRRDIDNRAHARRTG